MENIIFCAVQRNKATKRVKEGGWSKLKKDKQCKGVFIKYGDWKPSATYAHGNAVANS